MKYYIYFWKKFDTLIESLKTRPQENLELKFTQSKENFSLKPPLALEGKNSTIAVTNFEEIISVFSKS